MNCITLLNRYLSLSCSAPVMSPVSVTALACPQVCSPAPSSPHPSQFPLSADVAAAASCRSQPYPAGAPASCGCPLFLPAAPARRAGTARSSCSSAPPAASAPQPRDSMLLRVASRIVNV